MKIAVVGLANVGKTSLIRTLQRVYHIAGDSLAPTRNVERNNFTLFSKDGSIWDFGGQDQYRSIYLNNPERYFSEIRYLFYVIDIQDPDSFDDALNYYKIVYGFSTELSKEILVSVLYNKYDPALVEQKDQFDDNINKLTKKIREISPGAELLFGKTSIYNPAAVLTAFSKPILGDSELYNTISVLFSEYAMNHSVEYISVLIDDLFEAGSFKIKSENEKFISATVRFYQQFALVDMDDKIREYEFEGYKFVIIRGKIHNYQFTLNIAYPIESDSYPQEKDISDLIIQMETPFKQYQPELY